MHTSSKNNPNYQTAQRLRQKLLPMLLLVTMTPIVVACQTNTSGIKTVCTVWKPITYSSADTRETANQVRVNNASRDAWCR